MAKYKYHWCEWSVDKKHFTIKSDKELTLDEVDEIGRKGFAYSRGEVQATEHEGVDVIFEDIEYGDDVQSEAKNWEVK
tara:strand:+ start:389 stop:622 length:234 start_codon:yes stop_codon:yes gene_type:complete